VTVNQYAIETQAKRHFHAADPVLRDAGLRWYDQSLKDVRELSRLLPHGVGISAAAGVLAALSPQTQWVQNWLWARQVAQAAGEGRRRMPVIGGFPKNRDKAWRIANGEPPRQVLRGPKVTAFWRALKGDPDAAVLDIWMFRAFGLPDTPSAKVYRSAAEALSVAAYDLGVTARQLQAVIWLHVRGVRPGDPSDYFQPPTPITGSAN
jgi:hypothetical protein